MKILIIFFLILFGSAKAQKFELSDENLIKYYELTNEAENNIVNNDLNRANILYKKAFKEFKYPHAKDLYNSMKVALKTNDFESAYNNYQSLRCLGKSFSDDFIVENFKNSEKYKTKPCQNTLDLKYKKQLDSLVKIDQYYRKLSKGNYSAYRKMLTKNDSIASTNLLKLIKEKGFPNEYNIGLESTNNVFFHDFYLIIWHQLANNSISSQKVNFSKEINNALNIGKIRPDIAAFLIDLNNGTNDYSFFSVIMFINNNGEQDCCYIPKSFLTQNRNDLITQKIQHVNNKRKLLGLPAEEDDLKKNIFFIDNKNFIFLSRTINGLNFQNDEEARRFKESYMKIK